MVTDPWPRGKKYEEYKRSGMLDKIRVPPPAQLLPIVDCISAATAAESMPALRKACAQFMNALSDFYGVNPPVVKVFACARPHSTFEGRLASQLFGDYHLPSANIRLWSRTAMKRQWTSPGSMLATLCHEFMHHLDVSLLGFPGTYHTIGFFDRTHRLYLAASGHPYYELAWSLTVSVDARGRARYNAAAIDWVETNRQKAKALARKNRKT